MDAKSSFAALSLDRVRAWARLRGLSRSRVAAEAGISDNLTRKLFQPGYNPTLRTLDRLERAIPADQVEALCAVMRKRAA